MKYKVLFFISSIIILFAIANVRFNRFDNDSKFSEIRDDYNEKKFNSFLSKNLRIVESSVDSSELGRANYYLGYFYYNNKTDIRQSLKCLNKSLKYFRHSRDDSFRCKAIIALGCVYFDGSDYLTAENLFIKALNIASKRGLVVEQFKCEIYLGIIFQINGDLNHSLLYFHRAQNKLHSREVQQNLLNPSQTCQSNLARLYVEMGDLRSAELKYLSIIKSNQDVDFEIYAKALDNLADVYRRQRKFRKAFYLLSKSAEMRRSRKVSDGEINRLYILSKCQLDVGRSRESASAAKSGLSLSNGQPYVRASFLEVLILAEKINSAVYATQYIKISDSLQLAERRNRNKFARIAFETDELAQQKDTAVRQKKMAIATGSGLLVCSLLLLVIKIQRSKQRELLHAQQQQKADRAIYDLVNDHRLESDKIRQQEKNRIARELHDGVMNHLSSTRLNLYALKTSTDEQTIEKCIKLIDNLQGVEKELRQVAHDLSEDIFAGNKSFSGLLESLVTENSTLSDAKFHVEIDENINWELCESAIKINVYRVLQEMLNNTRKYAQAKNIFVTLSEMKGHLKVILYDDGVGFVAGKKTKGIGLKNITSRVESLGGTIKILSAPGQGVAFNISIPLGKS